MELSFVRRWGFCTKSYFIFLFSSSWLFGHKLCIFCQISYCCLLFRAQNFCCSFDLLSSLASLTASSLQGYLGERVSIWIFSSVPGSFLTGTWPPFIDRDLDCNLAQLREVREGLSISGCLVQVLFSFCRILWFSRSSENWRCFPSFSVAMSFLFLGGRSNSRHVLSRQGLYHLS